VLIRIERPVRVTLLDAEVQALKAGEIYDVSPVIGRVLVSDGWAREVDLDAGPPAGTVAAAGDGAGKPRSGL
jgi:hypothetical protein